MFIGASVALDSPMKLPAIPVGDEGTLVLSLVCYLAFPERNVIITKALNEFDPKGYPGISEAYDSSLLRTSSSPPGWLVPGHSHIY